MIASNLIVWFVLFAIAVSDARAHRIPNQLLLVLLVIVVVSCVVNTPTELLLSTLLNKSVALAIGFLVSLGLYLLRVMAAGDVKFIAVLGFLLGTEALTSYLFYVCLMIAFVGPMYWTINRLMQTQSVASQLSAQARASGGITAVMVQMELGKQHLTHTLSTGQGLTYMPFAPILIMGLALQQYYA